MTTVPSLLSPTFELDVVEMWNTLGQQMRYAQPHIFNVVKSWHDQYVPNHVGPAPRLHINMGKQQGHTQFWLILAHLYPNVLIAGYGRNETDELRSAASALKLEINKDQIVTFADVTDHQRMRLKNRVLIVDGYAQIPHAHLMATAQTRGVTGIIIS